MSAITGLYYLDGRAVLRSQLASMLKALAHRGRDASGVWVGGAAGLGHCMLWTTPESVGEHLPSPDKSGRFVITADARIDNRRELLTLLLPEEPESRVADSALILAAYEKWGEGCAEKLIGDFAFAIWDSAEKRLFCARDHFGVKPLYYYYLSSTIFAFSTEIKALFTLPEVPRQVDDTRLGDHLAGMFEDKEITLYRGILRLPPAHSLTVDESNAQLKSYWRLNPSNELRLSSDGEYAEAFRDLFTQAVDCRLRSAFPVGSMLSGGLDSSSITCTASRILSASKHKPLHTFSAVFDSVGESNERSFLEAVLAQDRYESHFFQADNAQPLAVLNHSRWRPDELQGAPNIYINLGLYERARSNGVRILLDGFDGDTTVSHGTGYLVELAESRRWLELTRELRGLSRNFNLPFTQTWLAYLWNFGADRMVPRQARSAKRLWKWMRRIVGGPPTVKQRSWRSLLNPDFVTRIQLAERRKQLFKHSVGSPLTERRDHYTRITSGVMPYTLEVLDSAAGAFSLDVRFPFWDKRLVEFCLALPASQKICRGWTRMILRRALAGILPEQVRWRRGKSNLSPALAKCLKVERTRLEEIIIRDSSLIEEYVDILALRQVFRRFDSGGAADDDVAAIWRAVSLYDWIKRSDRRN